MRLNLGLLEKVRLDAVIAGIVLVIILGISLLLDAFIGKIICLAACAAIGILCFVVIVDAVASRFKYVGKFDDY